MEQLNVITKRVDVLRMVKYYIDQLGIYGLFSKYVKKPVRSPVDPAKILSVVVASIVCASQPLYKVEQWAADYMDGLSEYGLNASMYNDDQIAKKLDCLFKADRNSFMCELSANAIGVYLPETKQIHNDSTLVTERCVQFHLYRYGRKSAFFIVLIYRDAGNSSNPNIRENNWLGFH